MLLVDTNIFLEILLNQDKSPECKEFLKSNIGNLAVSDFSLHSIGVILFRFGKEDIYSKFTVDMLPRVLLLSLPSSLYRELSQVKREKKMDFDDAYQYRLARHFNLGIVTMDRDFESVKDVPVQFIN
ncbi:MAG TPA: type II toxin-antitoxin system VapC family toxin [candidate division Zixibacteria bacterium]|nr:type II toxin-antitoxin system VapC family toxin [candidate division Zixibacteria bacterium]